VFQKSTRFRLLALLCAAVVLPAFAQSPADKKKAPEDLAADNFFTLRNDKEAKLDAARFQKLINAGVAFLTEYPTHRRASEVISNLANFGATMMRDKTQAPLRIAYLSQLDYEILNQRTKPDLSDDVRAALAALDAASAGMRTREQPNKDNMEAYREKLDTLAQLPSSGRFLDSQERGYVEVLTYMKPSAGEAYLRKLLEHPDKKVAAMAREELNFVEIGKQPFDLKFTALDGREVDFEKLRGKVVLLSFWNAANGKSVKDQDALSDIYYMYRKFSFEVVGVSCDKEEDREKAVKFVKDKRLGWAHSFDGKETKGEIAQKFGVRNPPVAFLFDQKGMLVARAIKMEQLEPNLKRLLGIK
jgi:peroxiredoxin